MASFYAELHIAGSSYRVVHCSYVCQQATDARGRAQAKVRHSPLELVLDVPDDDQLLAWAHAPHKPLAGAVVFYDVVAQVAHETIAFTAGECVQYAEQFASGEAGDGAYVCQLTITAPTFELRAGGPVAGAAEAVVAGSGGAPRVSEAEILSKNLALGGGEKVGAAAEEAAGEAVKAPAALTPLAIAKAVNPLKGTKNCTYIIDAIIARWHGIDPEAVAPNEGLRKLKEVEKTHNVKLEPIADFYSVFNTINASPEGTIALVAMGPRVVTEQSSGHIVAIVNHNGKATIIEAQYLSPYDPVEIITDPTRAIRRYGNDEQTELAFALIPPPSAVT